MGDYNVAPFNTAETSKRFSLKIFYSHFIFNSADLLYLVTGEHHRRPSVHTNRHRGNEPAIVSHRIGNSEQTNSPDRESVDAS